MFGEENCSVWHGVKQRPERPVAAAIVKLSKLIFLHEDGHNLVVLKKKGEISGNLSTGFQYIRSKLYTCLDKRPAVGVHFPSIDSGMAGSISPGSRKIPGHPTHNPLHRATTGATAVTSPPALNI